ncbi:hypothetical protein NESM_000542300 [Novymonas esmeraldas]|uniref:Uncharacterized protein n=1 Tax=Novymonas esmeraldas TaxID=1808958 RepID=A0AAW0EQZ7_9TRYP
MAAPSSSPLASAAARMHRRVSRIDRATAERLFPREQRLQWPTGYLPASGVAHLLRPEGVTYQEVLDCYMDIKSDRQHELQRDFASDYALWTRCALVDFVRRLGAQRRRRFARVTARDRLPHDADVRSVFELAPYLPPAPSTTDPTNPRRLSTPELQAAAAAAAAAACFQHQSYAATQEYAMLPVRGVRSPQERVRFPTYPQLRNVLHTDFDSMSALRALSLYSEDEIVYTRELLHTVALYLQRRVAELRDAEAAFAPAPTPSSTTASPVVVFFGNGRLAWQLNEFGLLPETVRAVQLPRQEARRSRRRAQLLRHQQTADGGELGLHSSFSAIFPCETLSVGDALRKYRPIIALVEPHVDRDYFADIRGYHTVREVLAMGPVDSPAMGSFAYPLLSFGVTPGPTTYWAYNDNLHKVRASERIQMPMDAPHESQGYARCFVDDISAHLISPNDCAAVGNQYRCLAFRRVRPPTPTAASSSSSSPAEPQP